MPDASQALIRAAAAVATTADLDAVLATLLEIGAGAVGAERAAILLHDPDRAKADLAASIGGEPSGDVVSDALETLQSRALAIRSRTDGSSQVDLPLVVAREGIEEAIGVATFEVPAGAASDAPEILRGIADLAAVATDRARLASLVAERSEWYERMAHSDPLTGLANQRTFGRVLELELARASRQGSEVSLAVFDVDGFVATNDAAGREAGDDVLRAIAVVLNESVRLVDTVARLGGDEFVIVAPGSAGATVAGRVLAGVAALAAIGGRPVSVSAGVARFPADGTTSDELLDAAMRALEAARGRGPGTLEETGSPVEPAS